LRTVTSSVLEDSICEHQGKDSGRLSTRAKTVAGSVLEDSTCEHQGKDSSKLSTWGQSVSTRPQQAQYLRTYLVSTRAKTEAGSVLVSTRPQDAQYLRIVLVSTRAKTVADSALEDSTCEHQGKDSSRLSTSNACVLKDAATYSHTQSISSSN
jgi:hypothetical protein